MNLRELQKEVLEWTEKNFPDAEKWEPLVGIMEELGELSHSFLKDHQRIRVSEPHREKMKDAIGDLFIYAAHFCNLNGFDSQSILDDTWDEVRKRDWKKNPSNGKTS